MGEVNVNRGAAPARPLTCLLNTAGGAQTQQACLMGKDLYWLSKPANAIRDSGQEPVGVASEGKVGLEQVRGHRALVCAWPLTWQWQDGAEPLAGERGGYPTLDTTTVKWHAKFDIWTCWWKPTSKNSHKIDYLTILTHVRDRVYFF